MPTGMTLSCPQCILLAFAAIGVYQYALRGRILNGTASDDDGEFRDTDAWEMDQSTSLLLLELLTNDRRQAHDSVITDTTRRPA